MGYERRRNGLIMSSFKMKGWSPFTQDEAHKVHQTSPAPAPKAEKEEKFGDWIHGGNKSYSKHFDANTARESDERSALKQFDPVKKPEGPSTPSTNAEYMNRQVWNLVERQKGGKDGQDIVKSKEDQIKDLKSDIAILKKRNKPGDEKRIKTLQDQINRLKNK